MRAPSVSCCVIMTVVLESVVACSSSSANKSLYALDPGRSKELYGRSPVELASLGQAPLTRGQVLQVRQVNVEPPFDGRSLVYRTPGGTYVRDYYNQWVISPREMLSTKMVDWLSASGPFEYAVDGRSTAPHRFALETSITSLYGDFRDPHHPKVVLAARFCLLDDSAGGRRVAYQGRHEIAIPLARASAQELVAGAGRAYRQLLESMTQDLSPFNKTAVAASGG